MLLISRISILLAFIAIVYSNITTTKTSTSAKLSTTNKIGSNITNTSTKALVTTTSSTKKAYNLSTSVSTTTKKISNVTTTTIKTSTTKKPLIKSTTRKPRRSTTKVPNIKSANDLINTIYANLNSKESRIARMMQREIIKLKVAQKNVTSIPTFHSVVSDMITLYSNSMTSANFPMYQIQSTGPEKPGCSSVVIKISTMERDIQRFTSVRSCASINASFLQEQVELMGNMSKNYRTNLTTDFDSFIESGSGIVTEMFNYTAMLEDAIRVENKIVSDLSAYRNRHCMFEAALSATLQKKVSSSAIPSNSNTKCCLNGGSGKFCCLNGADNSGCILPISCGTLLDFSFNDPFNSRTPGFKSGTFLDGTTIFPGIGFFPVCDGINPARISISSNESGAFTTCSNSIIGVVPNIHDQLRAKYFYGHSELKWVPVTPANVSSVPRTIKILDSKNNTNLVGRYNFTVRRKVYSQIGLYALQNFKSYYWNGRDPIETSEKFEVLTCGSCKNGGSGFYCCPNGAKNSDCCPNTGAGRFCCLNGADNHECTLPLQCGTILDLDSNDPENPFTPGFKSGTYLDGSTIYPGIGFFSDCNGTTPTRVSKLGNQSGGYTTCGNDLLYSREGIKYFYAHPQLKWTYTSSENVTLLPRTLKTHDIYNGPKFVARYNFTSEARNVTEIGFYSLDKKESYYWYDNFSVSSTWDNFEVLTCAACPKGSSGSFCCPNGAEDINCCPNSGTGRKCCLNGADNSACILPMPCGSLLDLTYNDPFSPLTPGFKSGTYLDGSVVFPGIAYYRDCYGKGPVRVSTSNNENGPGGYFTCYFDTDLYNSSVKYFYSHPLLKWVPASVENSFQIMRALKVYDDLGNPLIIGRFNFTVNNQTFSQIGTQTESSSDARYWNGNETVSTYENFEVLTCDPCTNGGLGLYCCLNGATNPDCCINNGTGPWCCTNGADNPNCELPLQCGSLFDLESYDPNSLFTPGFKSGTYIDGSTVFPGVGFFSDCAGTNPARISTTNFDYGPGAYTTCVDYKSFLYDISNGKYYYNHPQLKWVLTSPDQAKQVEGIVEVYDSNRVLEPVGRINITFENKTYSQIGYFNKDYFDYWNGKEGTKTSQKVEVLVCANQKV